MSKISASNVDSAGFASPSKRLSEPGILKIGPDILYEILEDLLNLC